MTYQSINQIDEINKIISVLENTPSVLNKLLLDLPSELIHTNEGEKTWSPFDILGHLIHGEKTDWINRIENILDENNHQEFVSFDRFAHFQNSKGKKLEQLLIEFSQLRKKNLDILVSKNLKSEDLLKEGIHPQLGKVTLRQLLSTWLTHDLNHIAQICRVIAKQYKNEVGPWIDYITILNK